MARYSSEPLEVSVSDGLRNPFLGQPFMEAAGLMSQEVVVVKMAENDSDSTANKSISGSLDTSMSVAGLK